MHNNPFLVFFGGWDASVFQKSAFALMPKNNNNNQGVNAT